jgi:hypothetical protein
MRAFLAFILGLPNSKKQPIATVCILAGARLSHKKP